jgi:hypothetical protein
MTDEGTELKRDAIPLNGAAWCMDRSKQANVLAQRRPQETKNIYKDRATPADYFSFSYSALASFRTGMSGSASFQTVKKSW